MKTELKKQCKILRIEREGKHKMTCVFGRVKFGRNYRGMQKVYDNCFGKI